MKIFKEFGRNPHLDWIAVLFVTIILTIGLAFTGYNLYNAVASGSIKGKNTKKTTTFTTLNEKAISSVIERFDEREQKSDAARKGYSGVSDPSVI